MDWFLYDNGLRYERVKGVSCFNLLVAFRNIFCFELPVTWLL